MFCLKKKKNNIKGQKGVLPRLDNLVLGLLSVHKKKILVKDNDVQV